MGIIVTNTDGKRVHLDRKAELLGLIDLVPDSSGYDSPASSVPATDCCRAARVPLRGGRFGTGTRPLTAHTRKSGQVPIVRSTLRAIWLFVIAVGTAVASGPPHRSVREALPHTAPLSGVTVKTFPSLRAVLAAFVEYSLNPAQSLVRDKRSKLPLSVPLSFTNSATAVAVLFVDFAGTMGTSEFLLAFMSDFPSETFSDRSSDARCMRKETNRTSRFSRLGCPRMHRVYDSAVFGRTLPIAVRSMWPSPSQDRIGTRKW